VLDEPSPGRDNRGMFTPGRGGRRLVPLAAVWLATLWLGSCEGDTVDPAGGIECTEQGGPTQRCHVTTGERCCTSVDGPSSCDSSCVGELGFACDGPEDCPGSVCCASSLSSSVCAATCEFAGQTRMCTTGSDCPLDAPCCLPTGINGVRLSVCTSSDLPSCL